jgi:hypothetical protein
MRRAPQELEGFLNAYPPRIRKLFLATRRAVLAAAPESNELIYNAYNAVTATGRYRGSHSRPTRRRG